MVFNVEGHGITWRGNSASGGAFYGSFDSQSASGGAFYGSFDSQSASGGAYSVATIVPFPGFKMGLYFKVPTLPASPMTLIDLNGATGGCVRGELWADGSVHYKAIISGNIIDVNLTTSNGSTGLNPVVPGAFHWLGMGMSWDAGSGHTFLSGAIWDGSGIVLGSWTSGLFGFGSGSPSMIFGVGIPGSGAGNIPFPNSAGWEWSKPYVVFHPGPPSNYDGPLLTDWLSSQVLAGYNCRQATGVTLVLNDVTGNYNMTPGAQGLNINTDGPYP